MTAKYDPAEVEQLVREAREEIARRQTATRCDSCGGLIMHRSEHWLAAMADQLDAARLEIDRLQQHAGAVYGEHADGTPCLECEVRMLRAQRTADFDEQAATYAAMQAEISKWRKAAHDGIDASLEHGVREADRRDARIAELEREIEALRCGDLVPFLDGELPPARHEAFARHLAHCVECQRDGVGHAQLDAVVSQMAAPRAPRGGDNG